MALTDPSRFVVAYHGCDEATARKVLIDGSDLTQSQNDYDWLGTGIYFWEQGPRRAYEFALEESKRTSTKIKNPAVLGAYIYLGTCLDLLDTECTERLSVAYDSFIAHLKHKKVPLPQNEKPRADGSKLFHRLDCAVINYAVSLSEVIDEIEFQSVRGVFWEGDPVYPGAEIRKKSHIQIAVRDPRCILGYFRPKNIAGAA